MRRTARSRAASRNLHHGKHRSPAKVTRTRGAGRSSSKGARVSDRRGQRQVPWAFQASTPQQVSLSDNYRSTAEGLCLFDMTPGRRLLPRASRPAVVNKKLGAAFVTWLRARRLTQSGSRQSGGTRPHRGAPELPWRRRRSRARSRR
jgi:hypothetical protein